MLHGAKTILFLQKYFLDKYLYQLLRKASACKKLFYELTYFKNLFSPGEEGGGVVPREAGPHPPQGCGSRGAQLHRRPPAAWPSAAPQPVLQQHAHETERGQAAQDVTHGILGDFLYFP